MVCVHVVGGVMCREVRIKGTVCGWVCQAGYCYDRMRMTMRVGKETWKCEQKGDERL